MFPEICKDADLELGLFLYCYNRIVAVPRYDVLLGIPWHRETKPKISNLKRKVAGGRHSLPVSHALSAMIQV